MFEDNKYHDFIRKMDRKISVQKEQIWELLNLGFEEKIIAKIKEEYGVEYLNENISVKFTTNKIEIYDLEVFQY